MEFIPTIVTHNNNDSQDIAKNLDTLRITPQHRSEWLDSGVDTELIDLNVESVPTDTDWLFGELYPKPERVNTGRLTSRFLRLFDDCQNSSGWIIRSIDPLTGLEMSDWLRFKPDPLTPLAKSWDKNDQKVKTLKYRSPSGQAARLTFLKVSGQVIQKIRSRYPEQLPASLAITPDNFWEVILNTPSLPLFLTEGEKKAGCLLSHGYIAIALPGIWMGRRTIKGPHGNKLSEFLVPDLELFAQSGRTVNFCFDTDIKPKTIKTVNNAIRSTAKLLTNKGCKVQIISLPLLGNNKGAVDDFIVSKGCDKFDELVTIADTFDYWQFKIEQQQRLTYHPNLTANTRDLSLIDLTLIPKLGLIVIAGGKGTGKSKLIQKIIKDDSVLLTGHRIFLMRDLCKKWGLDYREVLEWIKGCCIGSDGNQATRFGGCTESLLSMPDLEDFTLVLDEVDQVLLSLLTSDTCNKDGKRPAILAVFEKRIQTATRIIIASADVSNKEIDYIRKIRGEDTPIFLIKNDYISSGYHCTAFDTPNKTPIIDKILLDVKQGKKLWITCDSIKFSNYIKSLIEKACPNTSILLVNSKTSGGDEQQAFINTLNDKDASTVDLYQVVITTQSMGTGISDETGKFDAVYGIFEGVSGDSDIAQSLARQRYPIPRYIWVKKSGKIFNSYGSSFPAQIKQEITTKVEANQLLLSGFNSNITEHKFSLDDNPHFDLYCKYVSQDNHSKFKLRSRVINRLRYEGNQVDVITGEGNQETMGLLNEVRQEIKQEDFRLKKQARTIDKAEADRLDRQPVLKPEDNAALEAYHLKQFYNLVELDDKTLEFDRDGRSRSKVIRFELLLHGITAAIERDLKNIERQSKHGHGVFLPDLSNHSLGVRIRELLGLIDFLKPGVEFTNESLEPLGEFCRNNSEAIKLSIGLTIPEGMSNTWIFSKLCEQLGIKTQSKRQGRSQTRIIWIESESFEFISDIVARRQLDHDDVVWIPKFNVLGETIQHHSPEIYKEPPKPIEERDSGQELTETLWLMETAAQNQDTETLEQMRGIYSRKTLQDAAKILSQKSREAWLWVKGVIVSQNQLGFESTTG